MRWVLRLAQRVLRRRGEHGAIRPAAIVGTISLAVGLAGCSTGGSTSGTETVTGAISGAAAANLVNSDSEASLTFPTLNFTGPVTTSASNATIDTSTSQTITTSAGDFAITLTLRHKPRTRPTWTGQRDGLCTFTQDARTGNFVVDGSRSTGSFAGAIGNGSYLIRILGAAPLQPGKTTCNSSDTGDVVPQGASISLRAVGPLAPKSS
jgi:hypothetical protein